MTERIRYLDVETTGLHPEAELLEIAILDEHGTPLLDTLVKPVFEQEWSDAEEVHGISPSQVASSPTAAELTERIAYALQNAEVVCFNAMHDRCFVPVAARTWSRLHCAMEAFTHEFGEWDDYRGGRRFVSLADAAAQVLFPVKARHRAHADALACRAVWRYLNEPAERVRVDEIHAKRAAREEAQWTLRMEAHALDCRLTRTRSRQSAFWMRWLRFPLWMPPASEGKSAIERGRADDYHEALTLLFTGYTRAARDFRRRYRHLPEYRRKADIPAGLVALSNLQAPRWVADVITPQARFVSRSGRSFRLLYRADAFQEAYALHPLRRPLEPPQGHRLYTRTQLRAAGFTRAELVLLKPVAEEQNRKDWSWYPLFCLRELDVLNHPRPTHRKRSVGIGLQIEASLKWEREQRGTQ
jgi:DNA polymerase III epsilon subunit-like protein